MTLYLLYNYIQQIHYIIMYKQVLSLWVVSSLAYNALPIIPAHKRVVLQHVTLWQCAILSYS